MAEIRTEWHLVGDGVSSAERTPVTQEEAERIMREGIYKGSMNGHWLERREVSAWERVHG